MAQWRPIRQQDPTRTNANCNQVVFKHARLIVFEQWRHITGWHWPGVRKLQCAIHKQYDAVDGYNMFHSTKHIFMVRYFKERTCYWSWYRTSPSEDVLIYIYFFLNWFCHLYDTTQRRVFEKTSVWAHSTTKRHHPNRSTFVFLVGSMVNMYKRAIWRIRLGIRPFLDLQVSKQTIIHYIANIVQRVLIRATFVY